MKNKKLIGLDIGNNNIKISYKEEGTIINDEIYIEENIENNIIKDKDRFIEQFKNFLNKRKIKNYKISLSISNNNKNDIINRIITIENIKKKELKQAIDIEIEDLIPFNKEDYIYNWSILNEKDNTYKILLTILHKDILKCYKDIFNKMKVEFILLSPIEGITNDSINNENTILYIDVGYTHVDLIAIKNNIPILVKSLNFGIKKNEIDLIIEEINKTILICKNELNENIEEIKIIGNDIIDEKFKIILVNNNIKLNNNKNNKFIISENNLYYKEENYELIYYSNIKLDIDKNNIKYLIIGPIGIIVIFIILFNILNFKQQKVLEELKIKNNKQNEILKKIEKEYIKVKKKQDIQNTCNQIQNNKINYEEYMKEIRNIIPQTIQIDKIIIDNKKIKLIGTSPNYSELGYFLKNIEYSNKFTQPLFKYKDKTMLKKNLELKVIEYEIETNIRGNKDE